MEERETESQPVTEYVIDLKERLEAVGDQLRGQQYVVRQDQTKKPSLYFKGDKVWLRTHQKKKAENPKFAPKY